MFACREEVGCFIFEKLPNANKTIKEKKYVFQQYFSCNKISEEIKTTADAEALQP